MTLVTSETVGLPWEHEQPAFYSGSISEKTGGGTGMNITQSQLGETVDSGMDDTQQQGGEGGWDGGLSSVGKVSRLVNLA